ncbi:MAG: aminotransferase class III-fold pyridoxal phosphate-dependent enzyme, partial [Candidatus Binatia bacterium]
MFLQSKKLFRRALKKIPGGVNSPVRAWKSVGGSPLFISRGQGSYVFDADKRRYIDYVGSWGPMILGHANAKIIRAISRRAANGTTFGAPTLGEVELAELVSQRMPSIEKLRLVSSGTEATMSAIRLARAFTNRSKLVKFDGCYHGHSDGLLVKSGSGIATLSLPDSPGVPASIARETLTAKYNDLQSVQKIFHRYGNDIAAVIVEPVCGNMGVILPQADFLGGLHKMTTQSGVLL